ncbi:hypothetical protein L6Q21_09415 [Sandaracinobacter sp. RS1-74]|uniref:hypothetical protein n=1 Tax=Sandaracinobacteroides sayramensis TaxID=2913411 RepID=UPI001ED9E616|nr:hypothetical protein [Sandaracinobacteroides sayramensis]MCG2841197.1 hypothetical protein [Sandaracinobacteroides sayramensis]
MTDNVRAATARFARKSISAKMWNVAIFGLLVAVLLFAPLGQGVGLSAGQGALEQVNQHLAANSIASAEVGRLITRD